MAEPRDDVERAAQVLRVLHQHSGQAAMKQGNPEWAAVHEQAVDFIDYAMELHGLYHFPTPATVTDEHWARAWRERFVSERTNHYAATSSGYEEARARAEADANTFEDSFEAEMEKRANGKRDH